MSWFNFIGLIFVAVILIPNIIFAAKNKDGFQNFYHNKFVEIFEQIGRFGCFITMFLTPPFLNLGFKINGAKTAYIITGAVLVALYCLGWIIFGKENSIRKSLALSIIPSLLFIESGLLSLNFPLIILSLIFAPCHIIISYKNAKATEEKI
ncbi:MAG TPA: hypothetical protein DIW36_03795 [Ruminococcaceae bacterium]|nr:hypothetical protein [Oscillospiraceae bacterium]